MVHSRAAVDKFSAMMGGMMKTHTLRMYFMACLSAEEADPALCAVGRMACKRHPDEGKERDGKQNGGGNLEVFALDIQCNYHQEDAKDEY